MGETGLPLHTTPVLSSPKADTIPETSTTLWPYFKSNAAPGAFVQTTMSMSPRNALTDLMESSIWSAHPMSPSIV